MYTTTETLSASFLARLYRMPRPYHDADDWYRWHHRDLAAMDIISLRREGRRVQLRLDYEGDHRNRAWLSERLGEIREALVYRQKGERYDAA